jgi:hypothetical protein
VGRQVQVPGCVKRALAKYGAFAPGARQLVTLRVRGERERALEAVFTFQAVIGEDFLGGFPRLATGSGMIVTVKACDLPTGTNMVPHLWFHLFCSPPTTFQVKSIIAQRLP